MTADIMQFVWPATVLIIFLGMLALSWRALSIAHDLAKIVLQGGGQLPPEAKIVAPAQPAPQVKPPPSTAAGDAVVDAGLVNFIKKEEGFAPKAKWDYKQYTNGYGTKAASATEVIDQATAEARLTAEIAAAEKAVEKVAANAPKGVKQALTDLTFNAGAGWEELELGALVNAGRYEEAKAHLLQYNHAGGQVLADLTARREAEVKMFDNPL